MKKMLVGSKKLAWSKKLVTTAKVLWGILFQTYYLFISFSKQLVSARSRFCSPLKFAKLKEACKLGVRFTGSLLDEKTGEKLKNEMQISVDGLTTESFGE